MTRYAIIAALALAGCETTQPAVQVRTVTIEKPVPVACVDRSAIPAEPPLVGKRMTGDASHDVSIASASAMRLRAWGRELIALLRGCVRP